MERCERCKFEEIYFSVNSKGKIPCTLAMICYYILLIISHARFHGKFDENSPSRRSDLEMQYTVAKYFTDFFVFLLLVIAA